MVSLRQHLLTENEIKLLMELIDKFDGFRAQSSFRHEFKSFLSKMGLRLTAKQLHDLCSKREHAKYQHVVVLYDFAFVYVKNLLGLGKLSGEHSRIVQELRHLRTEQARDGGPANVADLLHLRGAFAPMPDYFCRKFFGYRRSSTLGQVIRFTLDAEGTADPKTIAYANRYWRPHGGGWQVHGAGWQIDNVIYLAGHARSFDEKRSLGLRLMSLVPWGNNYPIFSGLLLTKDDAGPIGARCVLIPRELHEMGPRYEGMPEAELFRSLCEIEDASSTLERLLPNRGGRPISADEVYDLISNISATVIKGRMNAQDKRYRDLIAVEREFRELCRENNPDMDYRDMMYRILREALDKQPKG